MSCPSTIRSKTFLLKSALVVVVVDNVVVDDVLLPFNSVNSSVVQLDSVVTNNAFRGFRDNRIVASVTFFSSGSDVPCGPCVSSDSCFS